MIVTGKCLCGAVQYRTSDEFDYPHVCSCPHCQKLAGGPMMAWVSVPLSGFEWTGSGGEPQWYYTYPDSKRGFCSNCGSQVCAQDDGADSIALTIMSLDQPAALEPKAQSFKDNAVAWLPIIGD